MPPQITPELKSRFTEWFEIGARIALPILLGVAGWTFTAISSLDKRVTIVERDLSHADTNTLKASLDALKVQMAVTQQQVGAISAMLEKIDRRLEAR